jgi:hypothetical protein
MDRGLHRRRKGQIAEPADAVIQEHLVVWLPTLAKSYPQTHLPPALTNLPHSAPRMNAKSLSLIFLSVSSIVASAHPGHDWVVYTSISELPLRPMHWTFASLLRL